MIGRGGVVWPSKETEIDMDELFLKKSLVFI